MPSWECFVGKERRMHMVADVVWLCMCVCGGDISGSGSGCLAVHGCLVFFGMWCECGSGS